MFESWNKPGARRAEIRKKKPHEFGNWWLEMRSQGIFGSIGIAATFCVLAMAIIMLREDSVPYRPGQYLSQNLVSRVNFAFKDKALLIQLRKFCSKCALICS